MTDYTRIIRVETDPCVIRELCLYDQGYRNTLSDRAMENLDILTVPNDPEDDSYTALGFIAMLGGKNLSRKFSSKKINGIFSLVEGSRPLLVGSDCLGEGSSSVIYNPNGVYTLIPGNNQSGNPSDQMQPEI